MTNLTTGRLALDGGSSSARDMHVILLLFFLSFLPNLSIGQTGEDHPEQLYGRTAQPYYILGEQVWYQVYALFEQDAASLSKIIYAEVIDPSGSIVLSQKLKMNQMTAAGDFRLNTDWNPGRYNIRVYSKWNLNFSPPSSYMIPFMVMNIPNDIPSEEQTSQLVQALSQESTYQPDLGKGIRTSLDQEIYRPRDPITLEIGLEAQTLASATVSISVTQLQYFEEAMADLPSLSMIEKAAPETYERISIEYPREQLFSIPISLTASSGQTFSSSFIEGIVHQSGKLNYTRVLDGIGKIEFNDVYGTSTIQFFDPNPFDTHPRLTAEIIEETLNLPDPPLSTEPIPDYAGMERYKAAYIQNLVLDKIFDVSTVFKPHTQPTPSHQRTPSLQFIVDEFIQFEDIFHFISEAILSIQIKKPPKRFKSAMPFTKGPMKGKMFSFGVYSETNNTEPIQLQYVTPMMYSVNDYLFYESDLILDLEWDNIESIELYRILEYLQFEFGPAGKSGVLGFRTKDGKTPLSIIRAAHNIQFQGYHIPSIYTNPLFVQANQGESKVPDYRPVNYWNPNVFISTQEPSKLKFSAIDAPGWYLIRAEGVTNQGQPVWTEQRFEVRLQSE